MGSGGAANGEAAGGGAANPNANNPEEPRISSLTGALDAGLVGANREFNRANNFGSWDPGYRVMEDDTRIQPLSRADELLLSVYGDTIHQNNGTHLNGGVRNDRLWQRRWLKVVSGDLKLWTPPRKHFEGKKFINMFANELAGVRTRDWNSERAMLFAPVILNRKSGVVKASDITKTISLRLQLWEAGRFTELVNETVCEARSGVAGRNPCEWGNDEVSESVAAAYNSMVLDGKIRGAVRFATSRGLGGPKRPDDTCSKTGEVILDVLKSKHRSIRLTEANADGTVDGFETYGGGAPMTVLHVSSDENIEGVGGKIRGGPGPSGVDA
jgi:hypothetical protein